MNQCHGMKRLAVRTGGGFRYTPTINLHHSCLTTHVALEKSYYNMEKKELDGIVLRECL